MDKLKEIGFYTLEDYRVRNVDEKSSMWRCEIIITEKCNFKCPYCRGLSSYIYGDREYKELTLEEIKRVIDIWCEDKPLKNIRFSGGEPTMHKDIYKIVRYAKSKQINRIAISTNGSAPFFVYKKLIEEGVNDFSISLDACCGNDGDKIAGLKGIWRIIVSNIKEISKLTYVTVGIVYNENNKEKLKQIIYFAHSLGVSDIRIISSAQYNKDDSIDIDEKILDKHPILKYRINNINNGRGVRGLMESDSKRCYLIIDDCIVAGDYHFPCVIYMREKGKPIGKVNDNMRKERVKWIKSHDCFKDKICRKNCLDVCIDYNNRYEELRCKKTE